MDVRTEIYNLAQKLQFGREGVSDEELVEFFDKHRLYFMENSKPVEYKPLEHHERFRAVRFVSCSCGSREDSCSEDGEGFYSQFYITFDGDVLRQKIKKQ